MWNRKPVEPQPDPEYRQVMQDAAEELRRRGFEQVHLENGYYDGPISGIADLNGEPHYFHRDDSDPELLDLHFVWPVDDETFALEREQWLIYVAWNTRYEAHEATTATHPGRGGVDARYDELQAQLEPLRVVPAGARRMRAEWGHAEDVEERYHASGTSYFVRWSEG